MAGFQTHIAVSSVTGASFAYLGMMQLQVPLESAVLAGGLCAIAGTLPDLDSDSGVPARETVAFAAAVVPMLLFQRLFLIGWSAEQMFLIGAPTYLFIRFVLGTLLKRFTVHRGMFHSIPAIGIAGLVAFLLIDHVNQTIRLYEAAAVSLGYFTHLVLDEIWSVQVKTGLPKFKKSFGSALKFASGDGNANSACFGLLILAGVAVLSDVSVNETVGTATAVSRPKRQRPTLVRPVSVPRELPELDGRPY